MLLAPERVEGALRRLAAVPRAALARLRDSGPRDVLHREWWTQETALLSLERIDVPLGAVDTSASGGAIEVFAGRLLYATGSGQLALVDLDAGEIAYQDLRAPMHYEEYSREHFREEVRFPQQQYRVEDLLVVPAGARDEADLYLSHHLFVPERDDLCFVVSRARIALREGALRRLGDWEELHRVARCHHLPDYDWSLNLHQAGGRMLPLDEDRILLSVGDFALAGDHADHPERDPGRLLPGSGEELSRILAVDVRGGGAEVYASGVRNSQGLARDARGRLWETEHGPQGGDEVNRLERGRDYGWPRVSYGTAYGSPRGELRLNPAQGRHDGFTPPVFAFVPSVGVSNLMAVPEGGPFRPWAGDLLVLAMREQALYRLRPEGEAIVYAEPIPLGLRPRDVALTPRGRIALLTDERKLVLLRDPAAEGPQRRKTLSIRGYAAVRKRERARLAGLEDFGGPRARFRENCGTCHRIDGLAAVGPPLGGLYERGVGAFPGYAYSDALARAGGGWSPRRLERFLRDPQGEIPGTAMEAVEMPESERRAVLEFVDRIGRDAPPSSPASPQP